MESKPPSRSRHILARVGIAAAAMGLFLLLRPDALKLVLVQLIAVLSVPVQARAAYRHDITPPALIEEYVRENKIRKLQIGAGDNSYPGWLNTDIEPSKDQAYLDASKPFPLPDSSFQYIFSEHVIEHLTYGQAVSMLKECHRVLTPGGRIRIATPNLMKLLELFQKMPSEEIQRYMQRKQEWHAWPQMPDPACYILNSEMRWFGHQFLYTPKMLHSTLEGAGFGDVKQFDVGESDDPTLSGLEARSHTNYKDVNVYETMIFQGVR